MFGLEGEIFGYVDNGILALCAVLGINADKKLGGSGVYGGLYGGLIGNTISDGVGALLDPSMRDTVIGITTGCLEVFILVYVVIKVWEKLVKNN
tara:strand:- start:10 stop:291 length:282 start_codon:yes stop_codon:yes gene_type:complete